MRFISELGPRIHGLVSAKLAVLPTSSKQLQLHLAGKKREARKDKFTKSPAKLKCHMAPARK